MLVFLQILGSLGVFLFGMKVLSEGIQKVAGQRMRQVMATMTKNRFSGLATGFGVTCLLQSSSATTVIVVSFVNVGLLTLVESIGVIMGANLGTTITAWIIAAVGKFSLSKIAIPIIGIGLPFYFIGKNRMKGWGEAGIGFGLLFFGLGLLKEAVPDVKGMLASDDPEVVQQAEAVLGWIKNMSQYGYGSYLLFLVLGVVLTLAVQSSSAAMAITVTLAMNNWIGFEVSCFIVLGENIGTTVTAWLAALGANHNAKRAARAHFMFNVLGVLWMLILFYPFKELVLWLAGSLPESFRMEKHESDIGFSLAIFHTLFNLTNICVLIGFVPLIATIVTKWVKAPKVEPEGRLTYISQSLVSTGNLNLPEAEKATVELARLTQDMFGGFVDVFNNPHQDLSDQVTALRAMEDRADHMTEDITEYLVRCSADEIGQDNATEVTQMIRIVAELEEITDTIYRLVKFTQRKYKNEAEFTSEATQGIREFTDLIARFITLYNEKMFRPISHAEIQTALVLEDDIDARRKKLNRLAMERMAATEPRPDIKAEILNMEFNNHLEKIGNYALNVMQGLYLMANREEAPGRIVAEIEKVVENLDDRRHPED